MDWKFNSAEFNPEGAFPLLPVGKYRVRIEEAEETKSKSGKDMIKLTLKVSPSGNLLWHYVVFDPERTQMTNQMLGSIYMSFGIKEADFQNVHAWVGKVGGVSVKHKKNDASGELQATVSFFLKREEVDKLPAWGEGEDDTPYKKW